MNDESLEQLERQIAGVSLGGAPASLRAAVLGDVERELRAARWDRRLARAAVVLLVVGLGMNAAAGLQSGPSWEGPSQVAATDAPRRSLVDTAVVVAEATDAKTGREFARQMAAMIGRRLTVAEVAAIDAALHRSPTTRTDDNKG